MAKDLASAVVGAFCLFAVLTVASTGPAPAGDPASFRAFLPRFEAGLHAFVNGDPTTGNRHVSRTAPGSILGGFGGCDVSGDPAHTVTIERSRVRVRGAAAPAPLPLRATHVFRRELGEWKLLHGHAEHNVTRAAP